MKRNLNALWGLLLIGLGVLYLLKNFGVLDGLEFIWPLLFAVAGLAFLFVFFTNREHWWALIPGFTLLGLAATTGSQLLLSEFPGEWSGAIFLGAIGLSFWAVYLARRDNWWAIIPGGVLLTLATTAAVSDRLEDVGTGGVFFLGLALTFALVFLFTRMRWALIPSAALAVMGVLFYIGFENLINFFWPIVLIFVGLFLIIRVLRPSRS
ncbi:MAG: DUF5668 domain-containing protein [Chloroflexota bacterium]